MYAGYLAEDPDGWIVNEPATLTYLQALGLKIECKIERWGRMLYNNDKEWTTPEADKAPWYTPGEDVASAKFYGFIITAMQGVDDSTRTATVTQLRGDGAIHGGRRNASREMRLTLRGWGADHDGLMAGMNWFRNIMTGANDNCHPRTAMSQCSDKRFAFVTDRPYVPTTGTANEKYAGTVASLLRRWRSYKECTVIDGPKVTARGTMGKASWIDVEVLISAADPFIYRNEGDTAGTTSGLTPTSHDNVNCGYASDAYDRIIDDPQDTIKKPPSVPALNIITMPATWNRYKITIPKKDSDSFGSVMPKVHVMAGSGALRNVRVRFYASDKEGTCDFEGDFFIRYLPAGHELYIDSVSRQIYGFTDTAEGFSGGNLVVGSQGRAITWPALSCRTSYAVWVDAASPLGSARVSVETSIRE